MLAEDGDREDGEPRHALERRFEELRWPDWRAERVESENKLSERARETKSNVSASLCSSTAPCSRLIVQLTRLED